MAENQDKLTCGCGQRFKTQAEMDKHAQSCPMAQQKSTGSSGEKTRSAG